MSDTNFVLDANVFIEAHKRYYAFDICPGYWATLLDRHSGGRVCSIDRVRDELLDQSDALADWVRQIPGAFFVRTGNRPEAEWYGRIMTWLQAQSAYSTAAKTDFAAKADGWLIAHAKAQGLTVATDEVLNPAIRRRVPVPNVCVAFGVDYVNTFDMLRALRASFG
jgi:hypothetical protein